MSAYGDKDATDELYDRAARLVVGTQRPSISMLQRVLRIGFSRACALIDTMEEDGFISAPNNCGQRTMRVNAGYFQVIDSGGTISAEESLCPLAGEPGGSRMQEHEPAMGPDGPIEEEPSMAMQYCAACQGSGIGSDGHTCGLCEGLGAVPVEAQ